MNQHRRRAVCLGEAMVVLTPDGGGPLDQSRLLRRSVGGAEANVAGGLAQLGVDTAWVSRLGADAFGRQVLADLAERGVDVGAVELDEDRPTGLYVKESGAGPTRMHYYRAGSAASAMSADLLNAEPVRQRLAAADLVHTSGITAGVVDPTAGLLDRLVQLRDRAGWGFRLSVDLNWRPSLWRENRPQRLVDLLRQADVVLLGTDEAEAALGTGDPAALRELLGPRPTLVVKSDAHAALALEPDGTTTRVDALAVEVVEPVGAGDGFAAGYLAGDLASLPMTARLRLGHLVAACALAAPGDHADPPVPAVCEALLAGSEDDWARIRVDHTGISSPVLAGSRWPR